MFAIQQFCLVTCTIKIFFWHLMFGGWMRPIYQLLLTLARSPFEHNICYKEGLLILVRIYRNCWSTTTYISLCTSVVVEAVHLCFLLIVWNSSQPQNSHWPILMWTVRSVLCMWRGHLINVCAFIYAGAYWIHVIDWWHRVYQRY